MRSSRPEVFCKKGVVRNLTKFTGKHLCQSLFFNKVAGLRQKTKIFCKKNMYKAKNTVPCFSIPQIKSYLLIYVMLLKALTYLLCNC